MGLWLTFSRAKKNKLDSLTQEILDIQVKKQEMEASLKQKELELQNEKQNQAIILKDREADFERQKRDWEADTRIKMQETVSLTKLDSEQRIKQIEIDHLRKLEEVKSKALNDIADARKRLSEEYFEKLSSELGKLHSEGNNSTRFVQDLALKMMEAAPQRDPKITVKTIAGKSQE